MKSTKESRIAPLETALDWLDDEMEAILETKESSSFEDLAPDQRMTYLVYSYDANVRNGGVMSFLDSQNGTRFAELGSALRAIGAGAVAKDLDAVIDILKGVRPDDPVSLRRDPDAFRALPIFSRFAEVESESTMLYYEYEPSPLQLLYEHVKRPRKRTGHGVQ